MRKLFSTLLVLTIVITLSGCKVESKVTEFTVTDREGNEVVVSTEITKIVSTAPSNTEVIIGLGLGDMLVAVDKYSPTEGLSSDISIINFREPDIELLISLEPDIVVASGHNKVGDEDPFKLLKEAGITVVYIPSADSLQGILHDITFIGLVLGRVDEAAEMTSDLQIEFDKIAAIAATITNKVDVYFEIGDYSGALYSFGTETFLNEVVNLVGGNNIYNSESGWINVSAEDIISKNPDIIITNQSNIEGIIDTIMNRTGFNTIDAVINNQIFVVNGNLTSRGSQNIIDGIREVAEALYPDVYDFE